MRATPGARQFSGRMMVIVGFVMLVLNAADYLFDWNQFGPWFVAVGIMFVAIGAGRVRSARSQR
ncbi:MAG: hypothetical protein IPP13_08120 [Kouleothrix sp.]|nr:hypothetical protein [Kouleothrix sp.]